MRGRCFSLSHFWFWIEPKLNDKCHKSTEISVRLHLLFMKQLSFPILPHCGLDRSRKVYTESTEIISEDNCINHSVSVERSCSPASAFSYPSFPGVQIYVVSNWVQRVQCRTRTHGVEVTCCLSTNQVRVCSQCCACENLRTGSEWRGL